MEGVLNKERQELITENMDLVEIILRNKCKNVQWLKDEMESALLCKLCECAAKYDFARDCSFRTYALKSMEWTFYNGIRKECQRGLSFANKVSTNELRQNFFVDINMYADILSDTSTSDIVDNILDLQTALEYEEREIVLFLIQGYSMQEISDIIGCNYTTFVSRVKNLRSKIRTIWSVEESVKTPA